MRKFSAQSNPRNLPAVRPNATPASTEKYDFSHLNEPVEKDSKNYMEGMKSTPEGIMPQTMKKFPSEAEIKEKYKVLYRGYRAGDPRPAEMLKTNNSTTWGYSYNPLYSSERGAPPGDFNIKGEPKIAYLGENVETAKMYAGPGGTVIRFSIPKAEYEALTKFDYGSEPSELFSSVSSVSTSSPLEHKRLTCVLGLVHESNIRHQESSRGTLQEGCSKRTHYIQ